VREKKHLKTRNTHLNTNQHDNLNKPFTNILNIINHGF